MTNTSIKAAIWTTWVIVVLLIPWLINSFITMEPWALFTAPDQERGIYLAVVFIIGLCTWVIPAILCDKVWKWRK